MSSYLPHYFLQHLWLANWSFKQAFPLWVTTITFNLLVNAAFFQAFIFGSLLKRMMPFLIPLDVYLEKSSQQPEYIGWFSSDSQVCEVRPWKTWDNIAVHWGDCNSAVVQNKLSVSCSAAQIRGGKDCSSAPQQQDNFLLHCWENTMHAVLSCAAAARGGGEAGMTDRTLHQLSGGSNHSKTQIARGKLGKLK